MKNIQRGICPLQRKTNRGPRRLRKEATNQRANVLSSHQRTYVPGGTGSNVHGVPHGRVLMLKMHLHIHPNYIIEVLSLNKIYQSKLDV